MARLVSSLPHRLQLWLGRRGFLPTVIVLKESHPDRPDRHSHELEVYGQLEPLQGRDIPLLYGEAMIHDGLKQVPALLVEYIRGKILTELPWEHLASNEARQVLQAGEDPYENGLSSEGVINPKLLASLRSVYDEMSKKGLVHGDPKPDNFMATVSRCGNYRVWAIDPEYTHPPDCMTNSSDFNSVVSDLACFIAPEKFVDQEPPPRPSWLGPHEDELRQRRRFEDVTIISDDDSEFWNGGY